MAVQQHVLNWLYSVLTSEYHDVNRTYGDVAQALSQYPSLSPRTDVHTFPSGVSALLLHLSGTIPVLFRGATYRFPISIWVPHAYPREAPLVYVTPTESMVVRPGQHVDPQGQVYHPYLVGWSEFWDKSSILDFLAILRDIFAKEPPVISRQSSRPPPPAGQATPTPPPVPPLPPDMAPRQAGRPQTPPVSASAAGPPALPPKPEETAVRRPFPGNDAPPVPSHPHPDGLDRAVSQYGHTAAQAAQGTPSNHMSRYESAPPLPPDTRGGPRPQGLPPPGAAQPSYQQPPPDRAQYQAEPPQAYGHADPRMASSSSSPLPTFFPPRQYAQPPLQQWQQPTLTRAKAKAPPPPDIMDEPLTLDIPSSSSVPAPPIPPNPEKDALLHQLAQTLQAMRELAREQNESSVAGLQAQRTAMFGALGSIHSEASALAQVSALVTSNTTILREALRTADGVIENSARHPAPGIDELLVAPTVVGNQLYELVAEERALADAIFVLGRAVERGRVSPAAFAKMTRSLAREWYLKKALVRKIGRGMGLAA